MAQTSVNIRIDEDLKKNFDYVCNELGMNMTTAITIFAKKVCREHRIPFEISYDPFYSNSNINAINESAKQLKEGKVIIKTFDELEAIANE
ncbi:MAG: type II toxin-antitoxin system RelB/DinJ family antitoxin [Acutalibacteraceae bacterium]|nr:type II toxin-antitoxin system RelB/DinJ family antitoxin [Acutalibacteraceae bacterium]